MIIFEQITTGQTIGISAKNEGKFYDAKLSAAINSSNLSMNADRGQDFWWRLQPEQQAIIEAWEQDPRMIETVSDYTKVPQDELTHANFLTYLAKELAMSGPADKSELNLQRDAKADYERRVAALRDADKVEVMPAFKAPGERPVPAEFLEDVAEAPKKKK